MVWLLPFAEAARFWVIVALTYLIGIAELPHVVAGSVEVFYLAAAGARGWGEVCFGYLLPSFIGNTLGGTALVAALAHAQTAGGGHESDA
jgi:formate/nitrite transporter FocA (FNT family)